jgi:hypothetical protein
MKSRTHAPPPAHVVALHLCGNGSGVSLSVCNLIREHAEPARLRMVDSVDLPPDPGSVYTDFVYHGARDRGLIIPSARFDPPLTL